VDLCREGTNETSARFAYALRSLDRNTMPEEGTMSDSKLFKASMIAVACALSVGLAACEKKGPLEQAGEEVDEAVDTMKRGGDESTTTKADDAVDEAREGAQDAADELKKD
jgi:predicted small lipoprotein YifL